MSLLQKLKNLFRGNYVEPQVRVTNEQSCSQNRRSSDPVANGPVEEVDESDLPTFRYHPDPIATENVIRSSNQCACCNRRRGYMYVGPTYAEEEYVEDICPWCISDGTAHSKLDVFFTDDLGIGDQGRWDEVAHSVVDEIVNRTPGFSGWQQELWWTHCGDGAEFLGRVGCKELKNFGIEAIDSIRANTGLDSDQEWEEFFAALDKDGSPTAYLFRCKNCGALGGYQDCD